HPAGRVADHERLLRPELPVRDDERAQRVVGDDRARVPDDMRVAGLEPQEAQRIEPGVHARDDREALRRRSTERPRAEPARERLVRPQELVTPKAHPAGATTTAPGSSTAACGVGAAGRATRSLSEYSLTFSLRPRISSSSI